MKISPMGHHPIPIDPEGFNTPAAIRQIQRGLNQLQEKAMVPENGQLGPETRQALQEFQKSNQLAATGEINQPTVEKLNQAVLAGSSKLPEDTSGEEASPAAGGRREELNLSGDLIRSKTGLKMANMEWAGVGGNIARPDPASDPSVKDKLHTSEPLGIGGGQGEDLKGHTLGVEDRSAGVAPPGERLRQAEHIWGDDARTSAQSASERSVDVGEGRNLEPIGLRQAENIWGDRHPGQDSVDQRAMMTDVTELTASEPEGLHRSESIWGERQFNATEADVIERPDARIEQDPGQNALQQGVDLVDDPEKH
jgi:peptidoglycan hydrolase-like protein with peptidoglycan-binding domain